MRIIGVGGGSDKEEDEKVKEKDKQMEDQEKDDGERNKSHFPVCLGFRKILISLFLDLGPCVHHKTRTVECCGAWQHDNIVQT